jgi:hypothetical protein
MTPQPKSHSSADLGSGLTVCGWVGVGLEHPYAG